MGALSWGLTIGLSAGVLIGVLLAGAAYLCFRIHNRRSAIGKTNSRRASTIPIRTNGDDTSTILSDSTFGMESPKATEFRVSSWLEGSRRRSLVSASGVPKYPYKDLQKATSNFTTVIGHGAFGAVYKALMPAGETVAVKVLDSKSKQGEKEFQTEVLLLGRLHHRNLVNLVGYCSEKGERMLIYVFMPNGSLASHLYSDKHIPLSWDLRISIALDVARGLEYLHDGAVPPVVHRDIKSSNILLDGNMRARVADFGLSREEKDIQHATNVRGTFGYLDPEYVSSRAFTKKSDVYSFGVLIFELITGRNPQQGLTEYVDLAAMNSEAVGWEEIVDPKLGGAYNAVELSNVANLAHRCLHPVSKRRPSMREIVQGLSSVFNGRQYAWNHARGQGKPSDPPVAISDHHRRPSSLGSGSDFADL
ncbi:protein kinase superfamily protein [Wolffia australiana]